METMQTGKGMPIKQYDTHLEGLEKENFDLKMQIAHLKLQLKDTTNQTTFSLPPPCDCKQKQEETQTILKDAKATIETLLQEKLQWEELYTTATLKTTALEEENEQIKGDCIKLSNHISAKKDGERESQRVLQQIKTEILTVKSELEETETLKNALHSLRSSYAQLKDEYIKLEEFSKGLEADYKVEVDKAYALAQEKAAVKEELFQAQRRAEEAAIYAKEQERKNALGEKVTEELKREKHLIQVQCDGVEKRAERIIAERNAQIQQTQQAYYQKREALSKADRAIAATEDSMKEYKDHLSRIHKRVFNALGRLESSEEITKAILATQNMTTHQIAEKLSSKNTIISTIRKEEEKILQELELTQRQAEKLKEEKGALLKEREEIRARLELKPESLKLAEEIGIKEFTTLNNLFAQFIAYTKSIISQNAQELGQREHFYEEERQERGKKMEVFQKKLQIALSELHACKSYLEEKKALIKTLKKCTPMLQKIDVSSEK
ncbi:hypothetical protein NEDG_02177 [Nematocida displodere]|uniref:Uncharacterized protein n=1 Tax=Nematocida displodere TaxID=1805483 RepID=A0A177EKU5_9MICR|nr:hypothetical protein NEDG_02177 [Nematocida displodere]